MTLPTFEYGKQNIILRGLETDVINSVQMVSVLSFKQQKKITSQKLGIVFRGQQCLLFHR